jgi:predicted metal-binding membrane protein
MRRRRVALWLLVAAAGSAVLAGAVLAKLAWEPVELPVPASPPPVATGELEPPRDCEVRDDPGGYASRPMAGSLSPKAREAFVLLANAEMLCWEVVGSNARVPDTAPAFRALAKDARAAEAFRDLVASATLSGQLYGLAGLYLTDSPAFAKEAIRYEQMGTDVSVLSQFGCVVNDERVGPFVKQYVRTGRFTESLLRVLGQADVEKGGRTRG